MNASRLPQVIRVIITLSAAAGPAFAEQGSMVMQSFDQDPNWEGVNNRLSPKKELMVKQDFGFSPTNFAGKAAGEIGGRVQRSTTPASCAAAIPPCTLNQRLTAAGSFAIRDCQPGAGVFFGFFQSQQPGGSGRPIGSLGLNMDFEGSGGRLAVRLINSANKSCGTFITPYLPGKFRPTPLRKDGTRYRWALAYDPDANGGSGQFRFTMDSAPHPGNEMDPALPPASQAEARRRFPHTTSFTIDLPPGYKMEGATFDRFGIMNMMKAGGAATLYFDDLEFNGLTESFGTDPGWISAGSRTEFIDREVTGAHDFGFSPATAHAGGRAGEVGGSLWRSGEFGWYAAKVGPLNLDQKLEASGRVRMLTAGPDSDMSIGWFSSERGRGEDADKRNFVGIHVGGPTRIGHYFIPQLATAKGTMAKVNQGPVIKPGKTLEWSFIYDPAANDGHGEMRVTLGNETVTLPLKPGQKAQGADLNRFGLFTSTAGGQMVKIFFDDIQYTAR